jgi:hypothetical protein
VIQYIGQAGILVFGMSAVFLANDPRPKVRRWGCVCGLLAQPFWLYEAGTHAQWGIAVSSLVYGYGWWRGFYHQWVRRT